jgi:hypothetical protein
MRTLLIAGLALPLGLLLPAAAPTPGRFADVPPGHWAASAVNELAALGILQGYPAPPAPRAGASPAAHLQAPRARPVRGPSLPRRPKRRRALR